MSESQYIYLLQEREFIKTKENVFKVGKTTKLNHERFNQYPKGSVLLFQMICSNCSDMESKVIKVFKDKFKLRKDIGNEYFEGDSDEMMNVIYSILTVSAVLDDSTNVKSLRLSTNVIPGINITRHLNCDILINQNDIEQYGFDKSKTEQEMIDLAIQNECPVVVKSGENGKWYLKGKNKSILSIKHKIEEHKGKFRNGVYCLLIE